MQFTWQTLQKTSFYNPDLTLRDKWKFRNHIAHLQNISNHIPEYFLSILWNKDWVPVSRTSPKTSFLGLYLTHCAKMRILKSFSPYARHVQSDPKIYFGYDLRCRWISSDKKFFGQTDGLTGVTTIYPNFL